MHRVIHLLGFGAQLANIKSMARQVGKFFTLGATAIAAAIALVAASDASARVYDQQIEAARLCTKHFPEQERLNGIPTHLLAAIASVESGRWNEELNMALPWPWTINVEGKGYYFGSKAEAVSKVKALLKSGIRSIDVGCMQVNLKHHPNAFATLDQAFDPHYNVVYAAKFLRTNYEDMRSWTRAAAAYHSKAPKEGKKYLTQIENTWSTIVGRVRKARANRDIASDERSGPRVVNVSQAGIDQSFGSLEKDFATEKVMEGGDVDQLNPPAKRAKEKGSASMRVIELSSRIDTPKSNVMVIRPTVSADAKDSTSAASARDRHMAAVKDDLFVMNKSDNAQAIGADKQEPEANVTEAPREKVRMANFVFVD